VSFAKFYQLPITGYESLRIMKRNTNTILLALFAVLALAASFPIWKGYFPFGKKSSVPSEFDFSKLEKDKIDKIVIKNNGDERSLTREGDGWKLNEFEVSLGELDRFFEALAGLEVGSLVSKNPEKHAKFGLGEGEGINFSLFSGDKLAAFVVGKTGSGINSFYIKKEGGEDIYLVHGDLRRQLLQDVSRWRDKTVVEVAGEAVAKVEIDSPSGSLVFTKSAGGRVVGGWGRSGGYRS